MPAAAGLSLVCPPFAGSGASLPRADTAIHENCRPTSRPPLDVMVTALRGGEGTHS
jgi:hypothetical protein